MAYAAYDMQLLSNQRKHQTYLDWRFLDWLVWVFSNRGQRKLHKNTQHFLITEKLFLFDETLLHI